MQPNNISVLMDQVLMLLQPQAMMNNIKLKSILTRIPLISCEGNQLKQVFVNILKMQLNLCRWEEKFSFN